LPAALFTVSTTPFPLRLLAVERDVARFFAGLALRFAPLRDPPLVDRVVVFEDGLRAVDFLEAVERFVLLCGVLAAIESLLRLACRFLPFGLPDRRAEDAMCENLQPP
jgi:hypothetical protein